MATKTPTLRRIRRRKLYERRSALPSSRCPRLDSDAQPSSATTFAPVVPCDGNTESIHSKDVEAPTSGFFCIDDAKTLEDSFPSILRLIDSLDDARQRSDCASFCVLASVFTTIVTDVVSCIATSEFVDSKGEHFILANSIVVLLLDRFTNKVRHLQSYKNRQYHMQLEMCESYESAKMVHESLTTLYRSGLKKPYKNKSLPPLPLPGVFQVPTSLGASYLPSASDATVKKLDRLPHMKSEDQSRRKKDIRSTHPVGNRRSGLPSPAVDSRVEHFNQRHTILFFGEARILPSDSHVDERWQPLKLNKRNRVQAVSVSSLVSFITSEESATDLCLIQTLLGNFRFFITPTEFFEELRARFELNLPSNHNDSTQRDSNIRANVLAVIYSWLDQHWQVDLDAIVLARIRAFVEEQSEKGFHGKLSTLLAKITLREDCSEEDVLDERKRRIALSSPARMVPPDGRKFIFHPSSDGLLQLDTEEGREELCRHLTMKMSLLFRRLDPIKIVRFWYKEGDSCRNYDKFKDEPGVKELAAISAYSEQLTLWIISSILQVKSVKGRVVQICFWTDVATRCMAHCDYSTAHNIYASLSFSSVIRLKKTILTIPWATKVQYKKLKMFFENERLFRETFDDLRPSLPCTAPIIRDIIHVKSKVEQQKTSNQELAIDSSNPSPRQKFIFFDECRVLQQAMRVLNKALMEYKYHENKDLSNWLNDRLEEFRTMNTRDIYDKLHEISKKRESTQVGIDDPWRYSSKPSNLSKGVARLVNKPMSTVKRRKKANAPFALLKALAFGYL